MPSSWSFLKELNLVKCLQVIPTTQDRVKISIGNIPMKNKGLLDKFTDFLIDRPFVGYFLPAGKA